MDFESQAAASDTLQQFWTLCRERGLAMTHQRQVIYQALRDMHGHPSPEEVYQRVRRQIPSISLGTVYKNIKTFEEAGFVREVSLHHGSSRLDVNMTPHHHLVCSRCKAMIDLPHQHIEPVRLTAPLPQGFRLERVFVEVIGLCPGCAVQTFLYPTPKGDISC